MGGLENDVMVTKNVNFDYTAVPPHNGIVTADGQLLIGSIGTTPNIAMVANTLTAGSGISIANGPGSITITNTAPATPTTDLHVARYIVSAGGSADGANYTTIASAITDAVAATGVQTIFVQPGTYTENFTWPENINIVAYDADALTPTVTIVGKITATSAGTRSMSGIRLQTNSDNFLSLTGANATNVRLVNCFLNATNGTGISQASSLGEIFCLYCQGDTNNQKFFDISAGGGLNFYWCRILNTGGSNPACTQSAGTLGIFYSEVYFPITTSGATAGFNIFKSILFTVITHGSTNATGSTIENCYLSSGTSSAISISASALLLIRDSTIQSTNTNPITGAGSITYCGLSFQGTSLVNTTTQTFFDFRPGRIPWDEITGTSQTAIPNSQYIANNAGLVTITLPATFAVGDIVWVVGKGTGLWSLVAAAGDTIHFGNQDTSAGGSITATNRYDAIQVVCTVANSEWSCNGISQGNLTVA